MPQQMIKGGYINTRTGSIKRRTKKETKRRSWREKRGGTRKKKHRRS